MNLIIGPPGEGVAEATALAAVRYGLDPVAVDRHVEADHGVERHDPGYDAAVDDAAMCLVTRVCSRPWCSCGQREAATHAIDCMMVAGSSPHAMANAAGEVFYPDNLDDAAHFASEHGARALDAAFWLDDPTPTTGAPFVDDRPSGCVCHYRDDIDWGEVPTPPPGGCRVHTPWAFPGYSLAQEALGPAESTLPTEADTHVPAIVTLDPL